MEYEGLAHACVEGERAGAIVVPGGKDLVDNVLLVLSHDQLVRLFAESDSLRGPVRLTNGFDGELRVVLLELSDDGCSLLPEVLSEILVFDVIEILAEDSEVVLELLPIREVCFLLLNEVNLPLVLEQDSNLGHERL